MNSTTISSKGQITLPAAMLREAGLEAGTKLFVVHTEHAIVLVPDEGSLSRLLAGAADGHYGDADRYLERERSSWTSGG